MEQRAELILTSNQVAMSKLHTSHYKEALSLLKKAEALARAADQVHLQSLTFNNLGCYYHRRKQPSVTLRYFQQALLLEQGDKAVSLSLAGTYLNICALYSQAGSMQRRYSRLGWR
jgi:tetratricopeptide (TPR) repeat protein